MTNSSDELNGWNEVLNQAEVESRLPEFTGGPILVYPIESAWIAGHHLGKWFSELNGLVEDYTDYSVEFEIRVRKNDNGLSSIWYICNFYEEGGKIIEYIEDDLESLKKTIETADKRFIPKFSNLRELVMKLTLMEQRKPQECQT